MLCAKLPMVYFGMIFSMVWPWEVSAASSSSCISTKPVPAAISPGDVHVDFMGTTTLLFEDKDTQILIDGFFSRPGLLRAAIGLVQPDCQKITDALRRANIGPPKLRAIFVSHAHVDHALDAPTIARETGADLVGSASVASIATGHNFGRSVVPAESCSPCVYGDFHVTAIKAPHSKPNLVEGEIRERVPARAWARRYKAKDSFAFLIEHGDLKILVYPSAAYEAGLLKGQCADVVFLGTQGLGRKSADFATAYWNETVNLVGARVVYPIHWDNFGSDLSNPLKPFQWPFDNPVRNGDRLRVLGEAYDVSVRGLAVFNSFSLNDALQGQRSSRRCEKLNAAGHR